MINKYCIFIVMSNRNNDTYQGRRNVFQQVKSYRHKKPKAKTICQKVIEQLSKIIPISEN